MIAVKEINLTWEMFQLIYYYEVTRGPTATGRVRELVWYRPI